MQPGKNDGEIWQAQKRNSVTLCASP